MNNLPPWKIIYDYFNPTEEKLREALCALGNGYFGTRGAAPEIAASQNHYPGTYIAGVYNKLATNIANRKITNEDFVNCPNWLFLTFKVGNNNGWYSPDPRNISFYRQELDIKKGILSRTIKARDQKGRKTLIETKRIANMADPHLGAIEYAITPENYSGWITIKTMLDGSVTNSGVARYKKLKSKHLVPKSLGKFKPGGIYLSMKTCQSNIEIAEASRVFIFQGNKKISPKIEYFAKENKIIGQKFRFFAKEKERYRIEKVVSIYTSKGNDATNPKKAAIESVKKVSGLQKLLLDHQECWKKLWDKIDINLTGDAFSQHVLRFHMFHLLQTASPHTAKIDTGMPARGLHGEAYRGHIFWDEVFTFPFYNLHFPEVSKSLLLYRYRRLGEAKKYAKENGYRGAMFPWQSSSSGQEETQQYHLNPVSGKWGPDHSRLQRHISFAIGYNLWRYWKSSGDLDFLCQYGAEIILSIARFGASLAKHSHKDKKYHTEGIMGPDEFHEKYPPDSPKAGLKDNAYTNLMIVWTLLSAQEILAVLPAVNREKVLKKLKIEQEELKRWDDITKKMKIIVSKDGIISQFDGYFKLKELDWHKYKKKYKDIHRMDRILKAEGDSPNRYKISKQADLLMFFYLFSLSEIKEMFQRLGYDVNKAMLKKNYEYYIKRTSHGSTLSKITHCFIAHRLGKPDEAEKMFTEALMSDLYDTQNGTTPEGIHAGVMGGSIEIALRGFAGISTLGEYLKINPKMPEKWKKIKLNFAFKGNWIALSISNGAITVKVSEGKKKPFTTLIGVGEKIHKVPSGKKLELPAGKNSGRNK